jgi:hypothetical protein
MVNYVNTSIDNYGSGKDDLGTLSTIQTRFQIDF